MDKKRSDKRIKLGALALFLACFVTGCETPSSNIAKVQTTAMEKQAEVRQAELDAETQLAMKKMELEAEREQRESEQDFERERWEREDRLREEYGEDFDPSWVGESDYDQDDGLPGEDGAAD